MGAWRIHACFHRLSYTGNGSARWCGRVASVLPSAPDRATEQISTRDSGYDAATPGLPAAVASRSRGGSGGRVAHSCMLPPSLVQATAVHAGAGAWQVLPSVTNRATGLLSVRSGGYDAATPGLPAAVASRARGGCAVGALRIHACFPRLLVQATAVHTGACAWGKCC